MSEASEPHGSFGPADVSAPAARLSARRVVVGVTGGIACYKAAALVSRLAQGGADVTVLMTDAATRFVTPLTFESLSGRPVYTSLWQPTEAHDAQHVALARACELLIISPATAHTLAKLAAGLCDDVVTLVATALPQETPVLLAPSMNAEMWAHPITQENLQKLQRLLGYRCVGPASGWQACRTAGAGRMSEPEPIVDAAATLVDGGRPP